MPGCPCPESCLETVSTIIQPNLGPWCQRIAFEEQTIEFHLETSWLCCKGSYHCLALHPTWILFRSSGFHNLLDFDNQKSMGNWVVKNLSDLGCDQKPSDRRCQQTVGSAGLKIRRIGGGKKPSDRGCADLNTERSEEKKILRIPFEINTQKKNKKMDLKRNPTDHGRTNCAGEIWRKKNSFGYRNENLKTSDLDSADCVAKICWIIVPAAKSEDFFFPSDLMYAICVCEICGILLFYFEFV